MRKLLLQKAKSKSLVILFIVFGLGLNAQKINSEKSFVSFEVGGIGWSKVEGEIKGMSGSLIFDKNNLALSFFNVCIDPKTIFTDNEERDAHLKNADFFNTLKYPTICFKSTNVTKSESGYKVSGTLTLLETSKSISFDFVELIDNGKHVLVGTFELNRFDYGLATESYSSTFMVGKVVNIEIRCVLQE